MHPYCFTSCLSDSLTSRPSPRVGATFASTLLYPSTQESARCQVGEQEVGAEQVRGPKPHFLAARPCTRHPGSSGCEAYGSWGSLCLSCPLLVPWLGGPPAFSEAILHLYIGQEAFVRAVRSHPSITVSLTCVLPDSALSPEGMVLNSALSISQVPAAELG